MECLSLDSLRNAAIGAAVRAGEEWGVMLPALARDPARAQFMMFQIDPEDASRWFHPRECVELDPYEGRVLECRKLGPDDLGVAAEDWSRATSLVDTWTDRDSAANPFEIIENLQPTVWPVFLEQSTLTAAQATQIREFARAWSLAVWPHHRSD